MNLKKKERLDTLVVELGHFDSREKAKRAIMAGLVYVDGQRVDKPGSSVEIEALISVKGNAMPYVSRGGLKLEKAIKVFGLDFKDKVMIDIGASTGGFTDCALQNGAEKVYAVDVGYGQLDWKLRQDPRVMNLERTNIRYLESGKIEDLPDIATIDASFISLKLVLPKAKELTKHNGEIIALIKPQFEAGREKVGKKGVVRDPKTHLEVISSLCSFAAELDLFVEGLDFSPIKGPEGNIEYLLLLRKESKEPLTDLETHIKDVVDRAFTSAE